MTAVTIVAPLRVQAFNNWCINKHLMQEQLPNNARNQIQNENQSHLQSQQDNATNNVHIPKQGSNVNQTVIYQHQYVSNLPQTRGIVHATSSSPQRIVEWQEPNAKQPRTIHSSPSFTSCTGTVSLPSQTTNSSVNLHNEQMATGSHAQNSATSYKNSQQQQGRSRTQSLPDYTTMMQVLPQHSQYQRTVIQQHPQMVPSNTGNWVMNPSYAQPSNNYNVVVQVGQQPQYFNPQQPAQHHSSSFGYNVFVPMQQQHNSVMMQPVQQHQQPMNQSSFNPNNQTHVQYSENKQSVAAPYPNTHSILQRQGSTCASSSTVATNSTSASTQGSVEHGQSCSAGPIKQQPRASGKDIKTYSSKYRGVHWNKRSKAWWSRIEVHGRREHLGYYDDELEAAAAYDQRALELWGRRAQINFPNGRDDEGNHIDLESFKSSRRVRATAECTSKFRGVHWHKGTKAWLACIRADRKNEHLGYFADEVQAAKAYDARALEIRGAKARLNFPSHHSRGKRDVQQGADTVVGGSTTRNGAEAVVVGSTTSNGAEAVVVGSTSSNSAGATVVDSTTSNGAGAVVVDSAISTSAEAVVVGSTISNGTEATVVDSTTSNGAEAVVVGSTISNGAEATVVESTTSAVADAVVGDSAANKDADTTTAGRTDNSSADTAIVGFTTSAGADAA